MKSCNQMAQLQLGKRARETFQVMHHAFPTMVGRTQVIRKLQIVQ